MSKVNIIVFLLSFLSLTIICEIIDLTNYKYPTKESSDKLIRIAIIGTNDFHGAIFPTYYPDSKNKRFSYGGATNLYSYVKILKQQWGEQLLWLDGGDQFTGTMECMLSDCSIMKDYYNKVGVNGIGLGNHDFDFGLDYLKEFIKKQKFPVLAANVKINGKYLYDEWDNVLAYKVFTFPTSPNIKIGVIGLALVSTASQTSADISSLTFEDYFSTTKYWENYLRNVENVDAVLLLTHFGPICKGDIEEKMTLQMRDLNSQQNECDKNNEIMTFLEEIKNNGIQIDGVVAAHTHDIAHHWISSIPVIQSSGSDYFNILYLPFKVNKDDSLSLQNNKITIEGPVPVCEKLWPETKNCKYRYDDSSLMQDFIFHGENISLDEDLSNELKYWNDIINEKINNKICETKDEMFINNRESLLFNVVNEIGKIVTESDICFFNLYGLRTTWYKGPINEIDLFRMMPFNDTWIRFEMTGEEVYHMFQNLAKNNIYPNSGTLQILSYINSSYTMKNLLFFDGEEEKFLEPKRTYKICTNDFLANGGEGMGEVRKWYKELRNEKDFGLIRDILYNYLKRIKPITKEKFLDENYPRIIIDNFGKN